MDMNNLLIFLGVGAVSGWLAGLMVRGGSFGLLGNIVIGILGAVVGGYLFGLAGISAGGGLAGSIVSATVGAMVLLSLIRLVNRG
jgi:uncharacterized membrane protein YeaQ/YmgE (transglycosylase-associated protein family)